jgi:hypothetical protein
VPRRGPPARDHVGRAADRGHRGRGSTHWLGGWSKTDDLDARATKERLLRTGLATVAFAIWSFVVPGAAWYGIASVAEDADVFPLAAALAGAAFALLAEGLVRRVAKP